jgi:hypothetical protein
VGGIVAGVEEDEADAWDDLGVFWYGGGCLIGLLLIAIVVSYGRITHQQHFKRGNNGWLEQQRSKNNRGAHQDHSVSLPTTKYKYETRIQE